jgi:peptidoglycan/xylan/chitin deacetylase (PgdA/CDA1 family)
MLCRVPTDEPVAYLTFDDGPTPDLTPDLLNLLARYEARATFFLIGAHADSHPSLVRDLHEAGHTVGNHTWTHPDAWTVSTERIATEFRRTTRRLENLTGTSVRFLRPPYGHPTGPMREWCATHRQQMVMWDVMPGDFLRTATADRVERFVRRHIRPGAVIVLHDNPIVEGIMLPALRRLLQTLTAEGWRFRAL